MFKIGIIRESRTDDKRTPLVPKNVKSLLNKFNNTKIIVQPSETRCFSNDEYEKESAIIDENLSECDIILGVKEIEPNRLIPNKTYIFYCIEWAFFNFKYEINTFSVKLYNLRYNCCCKSTLCFV